MIANVSQVMCLLFNEIQVNTLQIRKMCEMLLNQCYTLENVTRMFSRSELRVHGNRFIRVRPERFLHVTNCL